MKKIPFYFTVDFEDFSYDLIRSAGNPSPPSRGKALEISYQRAEYFSKKFFNGKRFTFFVTGVLARNAPKLIKTIHENGHEIGCHYNFHDSIKLSNREDFSRNLDIAIESIENAIGEKPLGFRAPYFAIDSENTWAFEELARRFKYDSSYKISSAMNETFNGKFNFQQNVLCEFCIFELPVLLGCLKLRTGGTFLRLFPSGYTIKALKKTYESGYIPLIYMHPYEMTLNADFWVDWKDLQNLPFPGRLVKWVRQFQWLKLGHKSIENKLEDICKIFEHQGPMKQLLKNPVF